MTIYEMHSEFFGPLVRTIIGEVYIGWDEEDGTAMLYAIHEDGAMVVLMEWETK